MSQRPLALLGLAAVLGGCGLIPSPPRKLPVNHFLSDPRDFDTVRRVMVLPFHESYGVHANSPQVREAFVNELAKLGRFEVVPLPDRASEHEDINDSLTRGRLSTDALVTLSTRYQVDGVLIGSITSYRPYPPINLGLRLQLISLHSGRTVWAADGLYDSNDALILEDLQHYAGSFAAAEASMHGWELNLLAPRKYAAYVAHRLVASCANR
jgi:hypothetical protein